MWFAVVFLLVHGQPQAYTIGQPNGAFQSQRQCEQYLMSTDFEIDRAYLKKHQAASVASGKHCTQEGST